MLLIVSCLGFAGCRADRYIVRPIGEFDPHVGVITVVERSVDSSWEFNGTIKPGEIWRGGILGIPIAPGNNNVESLSAGILGSTILALVGRRCCRDTSAPQCAFDVGEAGRVGARSRRCYGWISFEIQVESVAADGGVTKVGACNGIIHVEGLEGQISMRVDRGLQILEVQTVALGSWSIVCRVREGLVGEKGIDRVCGWLWPISDPISKKTRDAQA